MSSNAPEYATIGMLKEVLDIFSMLYDFPPNPQLMSHYQREYIYSLRALTNELKKKLEGKNVSLKYILEKCNHLATCGEDFAIKDADYNKW